MKDLDFDELDKAVSSLMADASTPTSSTKDDPKTTVLQEEIPPAPKSSSETEEEHGPSEDVTAPDKTTESTVRTEEESPVVASVAQDTPAVPGDDTSKTVPSFAPKRTGRFMDVVHPSSDMRKSGLPSRNNTAAIEPLNPTAIPSAPSASSDVTSSDSSTDASEDAAVSAWPDPIDMQEKADSPPTLEDDTAEQPKASDAPSDDSSTDAPETEATSPFLPDAKVEKRPLGGSSLGTTDTPKDTTPMEVMPEDPLPAELGSDVLAIESNGATLPPEPDASSVKTSSQATKPEVSLLEGGVTEPAPKSTAPVSIAPQYKQEENTRDQSHAPLYDSVADPHALIHPAKKKSGLWVVLAILALILIGAGVGVFAYFQGLV